MNQAIRFVLTCMVPLLLTIATGFPAAGEAPKTKESFVREGGWTAARSRFKNEWQALKNDETAMYENVAEKARKKWRRYVSSTRTRWVKYSPDAETRSVVDFEAGLIVVETTVPVNETPTPSVSRNIRRQVRDIFNRPDPVSGNLFKGQVTDKTGKTITAENLDQFIGEQVLPSVAAGQATYTGGDEIERRTYKSRIAMVPDHIRIRAEKYAPIVREVAAQHQISPALIMAMIHTESCFNPWAVSRCGAYGLMQIIPAQAGRDAYLFLYGKDRQVTRGYLFNPRNNISLGVAYFNLLKNRHFFDIKDHSKQRYVALASYNWGPTRVKRKILLRYNIRQMTPEATYKLLRSRSPEETSDYLARVMRLIPRYEPLFT